MVSVSTFLFLLLHVFSKPNLENKSPDNSDIATSESCRNDAEGLRLTIFLISMWFVWTILFYALTLYLNAKDIHSFSSLYSLFRKESKVDNFRTETYSTASSYSPLLENSAE